jgi:hypothetical protein
MGPPPLRRLLTVVAAAQGRAGGGRALVAPLLGEQARRNEECLKKREIGYGYLGGLPPA